MAGGKLESVYDVIVVGSGAGALSTAVTAARQGLHVLVVEKEPLVGGTTARSGGVLWIPCSPHAQALGIDDDLESARTYLRHEAGPHYDAQRVEAYLRNGPKMVEFFERETAVKFVAVPDFADYHPDAPGGRPGGRSILAAPFQASELGRDIERLRPPLREITFVGMMFNSSKEVSHFFNCTRSLSSAWYVARRLLAHAREMLVHGRPQRLTNGNALAARLVRSALDAGVHIATSTPALALISKDGRVAGVRVHVQGEARDLHARRGVVLAAGGFPHGVERRRRLFPHAPTGAEHHSPAPPGNTGDGLLLAESAGAQIVEDLPNAAAWIPVSRVPRGNGEHGVFPHLIDRYKPGIIAIDGGGRRFCNEADSYHDVGQAMQRSGSESGETAAFLICDHRTLRRYGMGYVKPFPLPLWAHLRSGYLLRGRSLAELAAKAAIDAGELVRTVAQYNDGARLGEDRQYGRGSSAYNRFLGDANHKPNPCVAPIEQGPFYAVKVLMGDLGTFAGVRTDHFARALTAAGAVVPGLYAVGNDSASVMGGNYPGGGITLGPAMTFGYIAGCHLAGVAEDAASVPLDTSERREAHAAQ